MKSLLTKKVVIALVGLAVLGSAGGAVAATQSSGDSGRQAYIDDLAKHLGTSPTALTAAMKAAAIDRINAAVAAGRLTQAEGNTLKQRIQQGDGAGLFDHRFGGHDLHGGLPAAAQYLGIPETTLRSDLQSGKSLAQITSSTPGKSVAGLKAAITAAEKARLDKAVSSGRITSQQEQQRLNRLSSRIDALVAHAGSLGFRDGQGYGAHGS